MSTEPLAHIHTETGPVQPELPLSPNDLIGHAQRLDRLRTYDRSVRRALRAATKAADAILADHELSQKAEAYYRLLSAEEAEEHEDELLQDRRKLAGTLIGIDTINRLIGTPSMAPVLETVLNAACTIAHFEAMRRSATPGSHRATLLDRDAIERTISEHFHPLILEGIVRDHDTARITSPDDLREAIIHARTASAIAALMPEARRQALDAWIARKAASRDPILMTEYDQSVIAQIESLHEQNPRLAGVLAYGPPGTGKTLTLIEANRLEGYNTHVVSMEHHADFVRLIGERKIPLDLGHNGRLGELIAFRSFLASHQPDALITHAIERSLSIERLIAFAPRLQATLKEEGRDLTPNDYARLRDEILMYIDAQIVTHGLTGEQQQPSPEQAWANGEILAALERGERVILDEIDKAPPQALAGLLNLLSSRRNAPITIGGRELELQDWMRIDATSNSADFPEYLKDRFTMFHMPQPPVSDILKKVCVWLADREGNIRISDQDQARIAAFIQYIVPRIMDLAEEKRIAYPLTLRGIQDICTALKDGRRLQDVMRDSILHQGVLAVTDSHLNALRSALMAFEGTILDHVLIGPHTNGRTWDERVTESPLLTAAITQEMPSTNGSCRSVPISAEQHALLIGSYKGATHAEPSSIRSLPNGMVVAIEPVGDHARIVFTDKHGSVLAETGRVYNSNDELLSVSSNGEWAVVTDKKGHTTLAHHLEERHTQLRSEGCILQVSPAGKSCTIFDTHSHSLIVKFGFPNQQDSVDVSASDGTIMSSQWSNDGRFLLVTTDKGTHLVDIDPRIRIGSKYTCSDRTLIDPDAGWRIDGTVIWHPDHQRVYLIE